VPVTTLVPEPRITLTYPALESSREVVFLIAGAEKRAVVTRVRAGDRRCRPLACAREARCTGSLTVWPHPRRLARDWEVAWAPQFTLAAEGALRLPT